jgi:TonB family protein
MRNTIFQIIAPAARVDEDDRRLIVSALPVLLVVAFVFGALYAERVAPILSRINEPLELAALRQQRHKIYPVLVEQEYRPEARTDQERALSDVSAEGTGGITVLEGFHTLSNDDTFERGGAPAVAPAANPAHETAERRTGPGEKVESETRPQPDRQQTTNAARPGSGRLTRIPSNYRFRQDFALRYDGQDMFSIAREELIGYAYFRRMTRQIRESFPLIGNWSYRDPYGYIINEQVKPQVVTVQFLIDDDGRVLDVRKVSSIGQDNVDAACLNTLRNQNFGPPPQEVLDTYGNIFGINFVFPAAIRY